MLAGTYSKERIKFQEYLCNKFRPNERANWKYKTCGSAALSVLTGIDAVKIEKQLPANQKHWSRTGAYNFLRNRKFKVQPVTKCDVTRGFDLREYIKPQHVMLMQVDTLIFQVLFQILSDRPTNATMPTNFLFLAALISAVPTDV